MRAEVFLEKGGYFKNIKNYKIVFTEKIKKLFLDSCSNCIIILNEKCYTRVELLRCHNITLICKKEIYNLLIDISYNIHIKLNAKYKDYTYIFTTSCIDITGETEIKNFLKKPIKKPLNIRWSMFKELYSTNFIKDETIYDQIIY